MATQPNSLPFQLKFMQGYRTTELTEFVSDPNLATGFDSVPEVKENIDLSLHFVSDDPLARLYMDGLDMLADHPRVKEDDQKVDYLAPSEDAFVLFKNQSEYYPLIPGRYRLCVVTGDNQSYFSSFEVVPKQVSKAQWTVMRDELEEEIRGLAQDLIWKNLSIGDPLFHFLPPEQLFRLLVIHDHFNAVMSALTDLQTKVRSQIKTDYKLVPTDRAKSADEQTVRYRMTHPENPDHLLVPVRDLEYDLPENRWLLQTIRQVTRYLDEVELSIQVERKRLLLEAESPSDDLNQTLYLNDSNRLLKIAEDLLRYEELARKMRNGFQILKATHWFGQVHPAGNASLAPVVLMDSRYRIVYQLHRDLKSDSTDVNLDDSFSYQWKRSDQLYEMWSFIKICKLLPELGYKPTQGWLYDHPAQNRSILIPTLDPGTRIVFEKDDVTIRFSYNASVPPADESTTPEENPVYFNARFHFWPDGRMDVYKYGVYIGTIMFEFKYRPRYGEFKFWNPTPDRGRNRPKPTTQIITYRADSGSHCLYGDYVPPIKRARYLPVIETWAMYPRHTAETSSVEFDNTYQTRLVPLTPGDDLSHVVRSLDEVLQNVFELAKYEGIE